MAEVKVNDEFATPGEGAAGRRRDYAGADQVESDRLEDLFEQLVAEAKAKEH